MTIMNDLKFDRTVSAAFTGHRFYDFSQMDTYSGAYPFTFRQLIRV